MSDFRQKAKDIISNIDRLLTEYKYEKYPDKKILEEGKYLIEKIIQNREPFGFFKEEEGKYGVQRFNFDHSLKTIEHDEKNKEYLDEEIKSIVDDIKNIVEMKKPYNKINELPMLIEKYNNKLVELYENETQSIELILKNYKSEVISYLEGIDFVEEFKSKYIDKFNILIEKFRNTKEFNEILAMPQIFVRTKKNCIEKIDRESAKINKDDNTGNENIILVVKYIRRIII